MTPPKFDPIPLLGKMTRNTLENYIVPGLASSLVGGEGFGTVRMFECERNHEESIVPHSHRFDFMCLVLAGSVRNVKWLEEGLFDEAEDCDRYQSSKLIYKGDPGQYEKVSDEIKNYTTSVTEYLEGDWYGMKADEIHSIYFSRGAKVLFFEGPPIRDSTIILEPYVNGAVVPTFEVKPWMFQPARPF